MKTLPFRRRRNGATLLLTLSCIAILTITAAFTLRRVSPRFFAASQFAAWQESRLAAEAGVDVALHELEVNAIGVDDSPWPGWQQNSPNGVVAAQPTTLRRVNGNPITTLSGSPGSVGKLLTTLGLGSTGPGKAYGKIGKAYAAGAGAGSSTLESLKLKI